MHASKDTIHGFFKALFLEVHITELHRSNAIFAVSTIKPWKSGPNFFELCKRTYLPASNNQVDLQHHRYALFTIKLLKE